MERDPRKDPRPGDVIRDGSGITLIIRVLNDRVWWALAGQKGNVLYDMPIEPWIKWSKDDEVLHVAQRGVAAGCN